MATPSRDELIAMALDTRERAKTFQRTYTNKSGEVLTVPQPDFKAELQAVALIARLAGYMDKPGEMDLPSVLRELERLGVRVTGAN